MGACRAEARNFSSTNLPPESSNSAPSNVTPFPGQKARKRSLEIRHLLDQPVNPRTKAKLEFELLVINELTGNLTQAEITDARDRFGAKWLRQRGDGRNNHNTLINYLTLPAVNLKDHGLVSVMGKIRIEAKISYGYHSSRFGDGFDGPSSKI